MKNDQPIIALDFDSKERALEFLELFNHESLNVKIGMELFYSAGPDFVKEVVDAGHKVFLDLKLYDIQNTVQHAMTQLAELGVSMINVHASGGIQMMKAAKEGLEAGVKSGQDRPMLIAVTQLTSRDSDTNMYEQQLAISQNESILHLAKLTKESGLDGVVCSPLEAERIKEVVGGDFQTVTPGIRLANHAIQNDDQVRITTPIKAASMGSDYIVVGRPITKSSEPVEVYRQVLDEWKSVVRGESNDK